MWKLLNKIYYINVEDIKNSVYKLSVTNFVNLWSAEFNSNDIIKIMLDSNKKIDADRLKFLEVGLDMLKNPNQLQKVEVIESPNSNFNLKLTQVRGTIVFSMGFTLKICAAEQFFYDVTRPLLQIIEDQHRSETKLRKQIEGMRGYLSKIPREILMRYEKQDIEDYNDVKHMQSHSVMESVFGKDTEEGVDLRNILNSRPLSLKPTLPVKEEPDLTDAGIVSSSNPSLSVCAIKKEPESQPSESTNDIIPNLGANEKKPIKEETNIESKIATTSLNSDSPTKTNKGTHLKCESETQSQNQRTPPKKRFNEQEVKTEVNDISSQSEPSLSQRHGLLMPKKKRKNLNY